MSSSHQTPAKTSVCLTFDVEFSIGGAFSDPHNMCPVGEPSVYCEIDGRSQGLGFILDTLAEHGLSATFFVEALNYHYFGDAPMSAIAADILAAGHDVQLHLHPCWRHFRSNDWETKLTDTPPNDSMIGRSTDELHTIIQEGIDSFSRWGLERPIAVRTGGLQVDKNVYQVLERIGIAFSSNIGVGISPPSDNELLLYSGCHLVENVLEIPVLSYHDLSRGQRKHMKTLTITGSSWGETQHLLQHASQYHVDPVVILSHPSEFAKAKDLQYTQLLPNRLNQSRFRKLCRFLARNHHQFDVLTFTEGHSQWSQNKSERNTLLSVPSYLALWRIIENKLNDGF